MFYKYNMWKKFLFKRAFDINKDIKREEINQYLMEGAILIDVRSPQEYREGHLNNAISIPFYQIKRNIEKQIPNKNQLIVLYCSTGHRGKEVQYTMERMGYTNVYNVYDGINIF